MFTTEVKVKALPVREWLDRYCFPGKFLDACKACPDYGRVWSCPPGVPEAEALLGRCRTAYLIGVKVCYRPADLARQIPGSLFFDSFEEIENSLRATARPGDVILTVGAGNIYKIGEDIVE